MEDNATKLRAKIRRHMRFAMIAWAVAIPPMWALLAWLKVSGGLPNGNWLAVATFPLFCAGSILGGMWLSARGDLKRAGRNSTS